MSSRVFFPVFSSFPWDHIAFRKWIFSTFSPSRNWIFSKNLWLPVFSMALNHFRSLDALPNEGNQPVFRVSSRPRVSLRRYNMKLRLGKALGHPDPEAEICPFVSTGPFAFREMRISYRNSTNQIHNSNLMSHTFLGLGTLQNQIQIIMISCFPQ